MREVVLALGSNLGDSAAILQGAVADLAAVPGLTITRASAVFETDPVGGPEQDPYLNAVLLGRTSLDDDALLDATQAVERAWHRVRDVRWGPRTLDVDIIAIDDERVRTPALEVPHPRAHERAFVLMPWLDADPQAVLPGRGPVRDLLDVLDAAGVRPTPVVLTVPDGGAPWTR
jgi:2-amino-4-hydroxy-6-hydroxymethyldihydropteridine diphosphokinase